MERIYDAHGPDMWGVEVSWGDNAKDIAVVSAYLDEQGQAKDHAPRGTLIALKLDLAGVDRMIRVLQRARRKTFVDPPSREVTEFANKLKSRLDSEAAAMVDTVLAEASADNCPHGATASRTDPTPTDPGHRA